MTKTNKINILAIETATSSCSVALSAGDLKFQRSEIGNNIHSQKLLSMIETVLSESQINVSELNAVAVGQGPGSFTGLRIGIGVAQGIAFGVNCKMLGISSLAALAQQAIDVGYVIAGIDARMNEVYWGVYRVSPTGVKLIGSLQLNPPKSINLELISQLGLDLDNQELVFAGNAWSEYENIFQQSLFTDLKHNRDEALPQAIGILELAHRAYNQSEFIDPIDFAPQYVRNDVAKKKAT